MVFIRGVYLKFKEALQKQSVQVLDRKQHITTEEMTKQALIIPFFQVLGYDVFTMLFLRMENHYIYRSKGSN